MSRMTSKPPKKARWQMCRGLPQLAMYIKRLHPVGWIDNSIRWAYGDHLKGKGYGKRWDEK